MTIRQPQSSQPRKRRLQSRFRQAALLLLLPLFGLAGVSSWGLIDSGNASAALVRAQQEQTQLDALHEDVQDTALKGTALLADRGADDLAAMMAAEARVAVDLAELDQVGNLNPNRRADVTAIQQSWQDSQGARQAVQASFAAAPLAPTATAALEDALAGKLTIVTDRLSTLEDLGAADVKVLQQQRDAAGRASLIGVVAALLLGLIGALLVSRRLARSILEPVKSLRLASDRIAAGDLSHRVVIATGDEIAEVGESFNLMANRLIDREEAVLHRERRLTALVENSSEGILVVTEDGQISFASPSFSDDFMGPGGAAIPLSDVVHPDDMARSRKAWERVLSGGGGTTSEAEVRLKRGDGEWRHVWARLTNRLDDPAVSGVVINVSDVSERHEHEQALTYQALHDALTGLANRELLRQRLDRGSLAGKRGGGQARTVLYLDFDDFKRVNDTFGHAAGDAFLVEMAARLVASVRPQDTVARVGGDEYAILLHETTTQDGVIAAERVLRALAQPLLIAGREVRSSASIGLASEVAAASGLETLLADADLAMYFAKRQGKGRFQVFTEAMRTDLLDRLQLGEDLRAAIDAGGLSVNYQPIVNVQTGRITGAEALARWQHPTRGWVGPATFIPLAEELGLVGQIDRWVLRQACLQGVTWAAAGQSSLRVAVNISGRDLDSPDLVATVAGILEETGFPPGNLELELTEGVAIAESGGAHATLSQLKELGLHLAIDDFGTGYSALSRLRSLPFDTLKVDKAFVDELATASADDRPTLVATILEMARVLGLQVVAEGVETSTQADYLRDRACEFAQGYLFSRPVDAAAFGALLTNGQSLSPPEATPLLGALSE